MKKICGAIGVIMLVGSSSFAASKINVKLETKIKSDSLATPLSDTNKIAPQQKVVFPTPFIVFPALETEYK